MKGAGNDPEETADGNPWKGFVDRFEKMKYVPNYFVRAVLRRGIIETFTFIAIFR